MLINVLRSMTLPIPRVPAEKTLPYCSRIPHIGVLYGRRFCVQLWYPTVRPGTGHMNCSFLDNCVPCMQNRGIIKRHWEAPFFYHSISCQSDISPEQCTHTFSYDSKCLNYCSKYNSMHLTATRLWLEIQSLPASPFSLKIDPRCFKTWSQLNMRAHGTSSFIWERVLIPLVFTLHMDVIV